MSIFLDHHSTTPVRSEVIEEISKHWDPRYGNAQSLHHAWGWASSHALGLAQERVASSLGTEPGEIFFTSGATESLFTVICGWFDQNKDHRPLMALSQIEHHSTIAAFEKVRLSGAQVETVPVDSKGHIEIEALKDLCSRGLKFFSLIHAHNEIGTLQKLDQILPVLRERDVAIHLDLSQSVGKVPLSLSSLQVDFASITGHKFGAPQGVGALYRNSVKDTPCSGLFSSGEKFERLGTPPVALIAGLGKAAEIATLELPAHLPRWTLLREMLLQGLRELDPDLTINGCWEHRLANNLNVTLPRLNPPKLSALSSRLGVSTSSACTSGDALNPILTALGVPAPLHRKTLRFGLGHNSTEEDVEGALTLLKACFET